MTSSGFETTMMMLCGATRAIWRDSATPGVEQKRPTLMPLTANRATSAATALFAATFWAFGVCFMWPTMLAAVARRFPKSGPWGIGLVGFAGALAIRFVLPQLGAIYDQAKLERAGSAEALAALQPGTPEMHGVLAYAAETSFQTVAIIPVVLFFVFGAVWFFERGKITK